MVPERWVIETDGAGICGPWAWTIEGADFGRVGGMFQKRWIFEHKTRRKRRIFSLPHPGQRILMSRRSFIQSDPEEMEGTWREVTGCSPGRR